MIEEPPNPRGGTPPTHSRGDGWTSGPRPDPAGTATAWAQLDAVLVTLPRKSCKRDTPGTNNLFTFLQVLSSIPSCLVKNGSNLKKNKSELASCRIGNPLAGPQWFYPKHVIGSSISAGTLWHLSLSSYESDHCPRCTVITSSLMLGAVSKAAEKLR